ncbi:MAG: hypothetical protein Q7K37_07360 [Dehalococcoidia bacterium]|nr:hypothetical protein [Dehalococcoidia bacterium]
MLINALIVLFVLYTVATVWQGRRALATQEPTAKLDEAKRLLFISALGIPLVGLLIVAAL